MFANNFIQDMSREFLRKIKHFILSCSKCNSCAIKYKNIFFRILWTKYHILFQSCGLRLLWKQGEGKLKILKNIFVNIKGFLLFQVCWLNILFHFDRLIFFLWSCEVKFASTSIRVTLLALLLLTLKGAILF